MKEWHNKYNPFNSMKVLMYPDHLEGYATENYLPPVTVAIDPINTCNLKCKWCNAVKIMDNEVERISVDEAKKLAGSGMDKRKKRGMLVSKLMKERGVSLAGASKIIKAEGLM